MSLKRSGLVLAMLWGSVLGAQDSNEARRLIGKMEDFLIRTTSLEFKYQVSAVQNGIKAVDLTGEVVLETGNKGKITYSGEMQRKSISMDQRSNGSEYLVSVVMGAAQEKSEQRTYAPSHFKENFTKSWLRLGIFTSVNAMIPPKNPPPKKDLPPLSMNTIAPIISYKLGEKETVDNREAQIVETQATQGEIKINSTFWLDPVKALPLKRVTILEAPAGSTTFTETYSEMKWNQKIDPERIKL
ncbi:MAG: hypothetical protein AMXMBFR7_47440 [Planctomycetota bacterium]